MRRVSDLILDVVARIPGGRVASYGQVAALAGRPRAARLVGAALASRRAPAGLPWWRVVNASGRISLPPEAGGIAQAKRLRAEGVRVDARGVIDLARYGWDPRPATRAPPPREKT